jgi:hypothetical protein
MEKEDVLIEIIRERLAVARLMALSFTGGFLATSVILVLSDVSKIQMMLGYGILIMMVYGVFLSIKNYKKYFNHLIDIYNTKE